jgi:hypothetical protein
MVHLLEWEGFFIFSNIITNIVLKKMETRKRNLPKSMRDDNKSESVRSKVKKEKQRFTFPIHPNDHITSKDVLNAITANDTVESANYRELLWKRELDRFENIVKNERFKCQNFINLAKAEMLENQNAISVSMVSLKKEIKQVWKKILNEDPENAGFVFSRDRCTHLVKLKLA